MWQSPKPWLPPPRAEHFVGRHESLRELTDCLSGGLNTVVEGPAGIGKTALAAEAICKLAGENGTSLSSTPFRDGVVTVDLYRLDADAEQVWRHLAVTLCPEELLIGSAEVQAKEACEGKQVLVVLTSADVADGENGRATVNELLQVLDAKCRWLVLSRMHVDMKSDRRINIEKGLPTEDAVTLLWKAEGGKGDKDLLYRMAEAVSGNPLGLTWAGGFLGAGYTKFIEQFVSADRQPRKDNAPSHELSEDVADFFQLMFHALPETSLRCVIAAGLLSARPFPLEAAEAVGIDEGVTEQLVSRKFLRSVVDDFSTTDTKPRYEFSHRASHRLAAELARDATGSWRKLTVWVRNELSRVLDAADGQRSELIGTLLAHFSALALASLRLRSDELVNFAQDVGQGRKHFERLCRTGHLNAIRKGLMAVRDSIGGSKTLRLEELGTADRQLVNLAILEGRTKEVDRSLHALRSDESSLPEDHETLARLELAMGNSIEAARYVSQSITEVRSTRVTERAESDQELACSLHLAGQIVASIGDWNSARERFAESQEIITGLIDSRESHGSRDREFNQHLQKVALVSLGDTYVFEWQAGEESAQDKAARYFEEALKVATDLHESGTRKKNRRFRDVAAIHCRLGDLAFLAGKGDEAFKRFGTSEAILAELVTKIPGDDWMRRELSVVRERMGDALVRMDLYSQAREYFQEAAESALALASKHFTNMALQQDLGIAAIKSADLELHAGNHHGVQRWTQYSTRTWERLDRHYPGQFERFKKQFGWAAGQVAKSVSIDGTKPRDKPVQLERYYRVSRPIAFSMREDNPWFDILVAPVMRFPPVSDEPVLPKPPKKPPSRRLDLTTLAYRLVVSGALAARELKTLRAAEIRDAAERLCPEADRPLHAADQRLREEYGNTNPPEIWQAWMKNVNSDLLERRNSELQS